MRMLSLKSVTCPEGLGNDKCLTGEHWNCNEQRMARYKLIQSDFHAGSLTVAHVIDEEQPSGSQARCQEFQAILGRVIDVNVKMSECYVAEVQAFRCGREKTLNCLCVWF